MDCSTKRQTLTRTDCFLFPTKYRKQPNTENAAKYWKRAVHVPSSMCFLYIRFFTFKNSSIWSSADKSPITTSPLMFHKSSITMSLFSLSWSLTLSKFSWIYFSMHRRKETWRTLRFKVKAIKTHANQPRWFKEREDRSPELRLSKWIHNNSVHLDGPLAMTQCTAAYRCLLKSYLFRSETVSRTVPV